ncbi:hypothetical protein IUY40_02645 [Flavobacterium sp. ALJ2]|uniref:hypothetical protein n=1 Tax=Flavobacterium sp. ALJ2 TaxID=2786960 RepID=UPI00189F628C|nr:hypothetical protein [Flavobacterium sp. ALJ2]MBF7090443.1 hypothetical protein [Flavobacterium sp. ALJ2]
MQINLRHQRIKESLKYLGWILLLVSIWLRGCSDKGNLSTNTKVEVPEVIGGFEAIKPDHVQVKKVSNSTPLNKTETIFIENPIDKKLIVENEKLQADFAKANDSIKDLKFNQAIQLNKFSTKFEDSNLTLNINGIVQGEVKEITPNYIIKEKIIDAPLKTKETVFRLLGGIELGNNAQLDNFNIKANLMLQNRKGNIISGSFDTLQNIWVGYNVSIFNIKR